MDDGQDSGLRAQGGKKKAGKKKAANKKAKKELKQVAGPCILRCAASRHTCEM